MAGWRGRACIYLRIPNSFQYVDPRVTPAVDPLQYRTLCESRCETPLFGMRRLTQTGAVQEEASRTKVGVSHFVKCLVRDMIDKVCQNHNINKSIAKIAKKRSVFSCLFTKCEWKLATGLGNIAFRKRLPTSICILSLLDLGRKVRVPSSIIV